MSFSYNRTGFVEKRNYNEIEHGIELNNALTNSAWNGLEYANNSVNSGFGINNGFPFQLGLSGESQSISTNYTGFLVVETTINSLNSTTKLIQSSTFKDYEESTKTVKYFTIYELKNGVVSKDYRMINWVRDLKIIPKGDGKYSISLNGFESPAVIFVPGVVEGYLEIKGSNNGGNFMKGTIRQEMIDKVRSTDEFVELAQSPIYGDFYKQLVIKDERNTSNITDTRLIFYPNATDFRNTFITFRSNTGTVREDPYFNKIKSGLRLDAIVRRGDLESNIVVLNTVLWSGASYLNEGSANVTLNLSLLEDPLKVYRSVIKKAIYCFDAYENGATLGTRRFHYIISDGNDGGQAGGPDGFYDPHTIIMPQNESNNTNSLNQEIIFKQFDYKADGHITPRSLGNALNNSKVLTCVMVDYVRVLI